VFIIRKRNINTNFSYERNRLTELSPSELNYAYRTRDAASAGSPAIGDYRSMGRTIFTKRIVVKALEERNMEQIRSISRHFFAVSGIYARAAKYMAFLPTYDYMLTPHIYNSGVKKESLMSDFSRGLGFIDSMNLKTRLGEISLNVLVDGAYYGYLRVYGDKAVIQDLPVEYCRSLYKVNGNPVVEFNLEYFKTFKVEQVRNQVLKTMPQEVIEGYRQLMSAPQDSPRNMKGEHWIMLDSAKAVKFSLNKDDSPLFAAAIPQIIDLDDLQGIQKKKAEQQLLKIMVQKIPLDKNGEFIFDMEEAKAMHANAVRMLARAINIDVLTTFADADLLDLEEKRGTATIEVENWEKSTFNELGISQQLFATDGNLALEKSIANDESIIMQLVYQYQDWTNNLLKLKFSEKARDYCFEIFFPRLTQHNRVDMAKNYKDQAAVGYSKMLPAIALGQSQSNFLASIVFEKDFLGLADYMEPVKMASTQSGKSGDGAGRPEKPDDQKSDKTLANEASGG
jgi:hypothetical protein